MMIIGMPREVTVTFEDYKTLVALEFMFISERCFHIVFLGGGTPTSITRFWCPVVSGVWWCPVKP